MRRYLIFTLLACVALAAGSALLDASPAVTAQESPTGQERLSVFEIFGNST